MPGAGDPKTKAPTAAFVKTLKEPGKHHDGKGMGLLLTVEPTRGRFRVQQLSIRGKRRELGLRRPRVVPLA